MGVAMTHLHRIAMLVVAALALAQALAPEGSGAWVPKTLTTARNGTTTTRPARDGLWLCKMAPIPMPDGTPFYLPTTLIKPNSSFVVGDSVILSKLPTVPGNITMKHELNLTTTPTTRRLRSNGIPNHAMGVFPIAPGSAAYAVYSTLPAEGYASAALIPTKPYRLDVTLPRNPKPNAKPTCVTDLVTAVSAQTGAAWHYEYAVDAAFNAVDPNAALATDLCWGHPYAEQYHYHGFSWKCFPNQGRAGEHSPLLGYALDGFGLYGPRSEGGRVVTNAQLDECHGHTHPIVWDGKLVPMYHYHTNAEYPYAIGCFRGTPVRMDPNTKGQQVSMATGKSATVADNRRVRSRDAQAADVAPGAAGMVYGRLQDLARYASHVLCGSKEGC